MRTSRNQSKSHEDHSPVGNMEEEEEEDTDDESDHWEDGDIIIPVVSDNKEKAVIVEFSDDDDRRPTKRRRQTTPSRRRRFSAQDKELAKLVHKVHLLCSLARGRLVDRASSDPLIHTALLSLVPKRLLKTLELGNSKLSANCLAPIVKWFHNNFRVKSINRAERRRFKQLNLASALQNRGGTQEEVAALSVALFRALNLTTRYVSVLNVSSLKPGDTDVIVMQSICDIGEEYSSSQPAASFSLRRDPLFSLRRGVKRLKSERISTPVGAPSLYWAEVFCSGQNITGGRWVHVDTINSIIDGERKVESACRKSLRYVVAFAGTGAKDVTSRYSNKWYKIASKRIDSNWWDAVLAPLRELESAATEGETGYADANSDNALRIMDMESSSSLSSCRRVATRNSLEDMDLQTRALNEPLPANQLAYKSHHLYAMEKWLGKYQMLHPKGPILGFCSGHPVYPRSCVQTLLTKQRWLREGLQVKSSESTPAKIIVKPSLKVSKVPQTAEPGAYHEEDEGDQGTIPLYGKWQTEPIDLPYAVNGIVPRNERGQVDVWSEKCLPHGTVHLRLPGVVSVAKRLCIDFAPAMVGFEFRNGRSLPVFEGIVVCTEFKDTIMEAYAEENERREAEEKKRNEAQAISRWYQLLSSIITRDRLNKTYGDGSSSQTTLHNRDNAISQPQTTNHENENLSRNNGSGRSSTRSDLPSREFSEDHEHVFPVEDQSFDEQSSVRTKRCPCGFSVQVEKL